MKNLKKTLAVVLAFAMVLSMGFSAFAYTDVTAGTKVAEAVTILSSLGIFEGFEDGTFKPEDTVTRAQMAAIICRALGYEDQAAASTGATNFTDVPASHWASGYINVAEALQVINGYGNGKFGPEDKVTYEQAIKMIVVALGYELDAQAKGGWYTGYLAVAAREGITRNSNGVVATPAARGTIAVLVYNSLEVRLMDQSVWTPIGEEDEFTRLNETILSRYLGIRKVEGVIASTPIADYAKKYNDDVDTRIIFGSNAKYYEYRSGKYTELALGQLEYDARLLPEIDTFAKKKVVAYVSDEVVDTTGKYMVYAVAEKPGANTVVTIGASQLYNPNNAQNGYVYYKDADGTKNELVLDIDTTRREVLAATVNFKAVDYVDSSADLIALTTGNNQDATISFISNDTDPQVDTILITRYDGVATVEEVKTEDGVVSFKCYGGQNIDDIDVDNDDKLSIVMKDGAVAKVEDIAAGDTVSYLALNRNFSMYYVSSKNVTGTASSYRASDNSVAIGGERYNKSVMSGTNMNDLNGKEVTAYLTVDGQIAYAEAVDEGNYGIIVAAGEGSGLSASFAVEVVLADGEAGTYSLRDKVSYVTTRGVKSTMDAEDVYNMLTAKLQYPTVNRASATAFRALNAVDVTDLAYRIVTKDGKITAIKEIAAGAGASGDNKEFNAENMRYGSVFFDEETVVASISLAANAKYVKSSDVTLGKVGDFFVDGEGSDRITLYNYDVDADRISGLVIGTGLTSTISQKEAAFVVASYSETEVDGYPVYEVVGFQGGKEVLYSFSTEKGGVRAADFGVGNVVLPGVVSADGMVYDVKVLFDYDSADGNRIKAADGQTGLSADEDEFYYYGELDTTVKPQAGYFFIDDNDASFEQLKDKKNEHGYDNGEGIIMMNSANYTLVDFSEGFGADDVVISRKSKGTGLFSRYNTDYNYAVFARYYDEVLVDLVVYRTAIPTARVATPQISFANGFATITCATPGAEIWYSIEGDPAEEYTAPVAVADGMDIEAWAVADGYTQSAIRTATAQYN